MQKEIIITQNILGQVTVELRMDGPCWSELQKSAAWKEVYQLLRVCQKQDSHQPIQEQAIVSEEAKKCAALAELNAKKAINGEKPIAKAI